MSRRRTALTAAALGLGAAGATIAAQRRAVRRIDSRPDTQAEVAFGGLRGRPMTVLADDGVRLHAEIDGEDRDDLAIVFSHGWTLTQDAWHFQREALRGVGRLVFWDHRGHGGSEAGGRYTAEQAGADLAAVIKQTVPEGTPVILVGHSMGGMATITYADLHPEAFGKQIVGTALVCTSPGDLHKLSLGLPKPAASMARVVLTSTVRAGQAGAPALERTRWLAHASTILLENQIAFGPHSSPSALRFSVDMLNETRMDALLGFIAGMRKPGAFGTLEALRNAETVVIGGELDALLPFSHSRRLADAIPGARLEAVPEAGHMAMMERPEFVNAHLADLIERVRP